jgi:RHS repeat-associated protein
VRTSEVRYKAWGEDRYTYGTSPTSYRYTGQRQEAAPGYWRGIGLYFYGARWYDAALGRFTSPDSIIPAQQGVMGNDRYAYVNNSPINFIDPSGHYGKDVHYDLTYEIAHDVAMDVADEEGFALEELRAFADYMASGIATGDMAADAQKPDGSVDLNYIYNEPLSPPGYTPAGDPVVGGGYQLSEAKNPHWYTTREATDALNAAENPFDFGIAMHKYQDSYSHWQKLGKPDSPIGIWWAHAKDLPNRNTPQSVDYFDPTNNPIDAAMQAGMTYKIETFTNYMINHWSYSGN